MGSERSVAQETKPGLSEVRAIASEVRKQFELGEVDEYLLRTAYQRYNPLEDPDLFLQRAKEYFPHLNCGLTTTYLQGKLQTGTIVNGRYRDQNHTFLLLDNPESEPIIIDITADQYGGPKVYVGPVEAPWSLNKE